MKKTKKKEEKPSAIEEVDSFKLEDIEIPKQYLKAFYAAQIFESILYYLLVYLISCVKIMVLKEGKGIISYSPTVPDLDKITLNEIYKRLQTFLKDEKYAKLMMLIKLAMENRNKFIHASFRMSSKTFSINDESFYLNSESKSTMVLWANSHMSVHQELKKLDDEFAKLNSI